MEEKNNSNNNLSVSSVLKFIKFLKEKNDSNNKSSMRDLLNSVKEMQDLIDEHYEKYSVVKDSAEQWKFFVISLHFI